MDGTSPRIASLLVVGSSRWMILTSHTRCEPHLAAALVPTVTHTCKASWVKVRVVPTVTHTCKAPNAITTMPVGPHHKDAITSQRLLRGHA